jgi:hypothetical protein
MKIFYLLVSVALILSGNQSLINMVQAAGLQDAFSGTSLNETATAAGYDPNKNDVLGIAGNYINIIIGFLGVLFLGLIIYSGFLWMTAAGNDKQIVTAKNIITRAVIGLIVVLSAYAITYFVLKILP